MGFAPASNPKLLSAVVVDEPQSRSIFGGTVAAPAFGQIMSFALSYLRIPPG
jgi:cell division protein FtsI/penicillin-binding protein 2